MSYLLDVSVLMAVQWEMHEHYERAPSLVRAYRRILHVPIDAIGLCSRFLKSAFGLRDQRRARLYDAAQSARRPRHRFIPDDLSAADRALRTELIGGPQQITDRYLAALARQHGLRLATLDEPLARAFADEPGLVAIIA